MSMHPTGTSRSRHTLLRQLATQAASHPRIEAAVLGAIRAELPGVIEGLLRDSYGGETVRIYVARNGGHEIKIERNRRILAMAGAPSHMQPAQIAQREGISVRQVQRVLARGDTLPPESVAPGRPK